MKLIGRSVLLLVLSLAVTSPVLAQQGAQGYGQNYETRLSALEDELRAMNGQVEQLSYAIRRLDQNMQRMQSDYDARLAKLESAPVPAQQSAPDARSAAPSGRQQQGALQQNGTTEGTLGALKQRDGQVTGAINAPQAPSLPEVSPTDMMTSQELYEDAFGKLRQADYEGAEKGFQQFIDTYPKDHMIENAKYWHAESLYVRGKFSDAAMGFADAFQQNPQGGKAPDSLLKLAMSLGAMNKNPDACTALAELKAKYPNASGPVKSRAADQRTKLKCNG